MKEIEAKILEVDAEQILERLETLGAQRSFDGLMHAIYFDKADGSLAGARIALRLRREGDVAVLAVKRKQVATTPGIKIAEEVETHVSDFDATALMLGMLGYQVVLEMRKHRIQYEFGGTHVVIDRYRGNHAHIPAFVEIEAPDERSLRQMAETLGFSPSDLSSMNSHELIDHYESRRLQP